MPIEREHCVKGGQNVPPEKRGFSVNRSLASEAGRKGGLAAQQRLKEPCSHCHATRRLCHRRKRDRKMNCCPFCSHTELKK